MEFYLNFGFEISKFFFERKTIVLQNFFDKISYPYNKTTQKF